MLRLMTIEIARALVLKSCTFPTFQDISDLFLTFIIRALYIVMDICKMGIEKIWEQYVKAIQIDC